MNSELPLSVPFLLDPLHLPFDDLVSFCVAVLLAVMVNAEGQAFLATLLGDARPNCEERLHFNPLFHMDIVGTLSFFIGGFGWPKRVDVNTETLTHPQLYHTLIRFGGPVANFFLANIAGSIVWIFGKANFDARVFSIVMAVNLTVAIYNLLPIPPLAGASLLYVLFPNMNEKFKWLYNQAGPFLLVGIFLMERITRSGILSGYLDPIVRSLFVFIKG